MTIDAFIINFESAIEGIEQGSVKADTILRDLPQFDSLATLSIIAMIDANYQTTINADDLAACATIQDLFETVKKKKG
jgi:acyl carrier protein